jgi:histidinol-phosphate aminotransferase
MSGIIRPVIILSTSQRVSKLILPKRAVLNVFSYPPPGGERYNSVRLDMNETTLDPELGLGLPPNWTNTYPDYEQLKNGLANLFGLGSDEVIPTNGADEGIQLIANTFIEPGEDTVLISDCGFPVIEITVSVAGGKVVKVPINSNYSDYSFNLDATESALKAGAKLLLFASPDNPTGAILPPQVVHEWCREFPNTLFVIDEAYSEFTQTSVLEYVPKQSNLLVLRSFSKAWSMAGLRLGAICGSRELLSYLEKVRLSFNVNAAAVWAFRTLNSQKASVEENARCTMERKRKLVEELETRGLRVIAGHANFFLLFMGEQCAQLCSFLKQQNILVRNRSTSQNSNGDPLWGMIRVTVGSEDEVARFIRCIDDFNLATQNQR